MEKVSVATTLTKSERTRIIDGVLARLDTSYVFPETAKKMTVELRAHAAKGEYDTLTEPQEFATQLTDDLRAVSHDRHLSVFYSPDPLPEDKESTDFDSPPPAPEDLRRLGAPINYGFSRVERLPGNIGYLDLRGFLPVDSGSSEACASAMNFLANTDALILDLRRNGGGEPAMVALVCSYFFDAGEEVHLNDIYWRPDNKTRQFKTLARVEGKRYGRTRDIYLLTSSRTFSGAEECAYNLKNLKRATLVGETTGGGAHPGGHQRVTDHFGVWVPMGRAISPITGTNWEGTGVEPDIKVPADDALHTAQKRALEKLLTAAKGDTRREEMLKRALVEQEAAPTK